MQADGVQADHYTMSIMLNALQRHGSPKEAQRILALLDASRVDAAPRRCSRTHSSSCTSEFAWLFLRWRAKLGSNAVLLSTLVKGFATEGRAD